jgi:H+-translocating NAD(P) transhydrogenase subunit alpha
MKIAVPKERRPHETRAAASPESVKKLIGLGAQVTVESGAGDGSFISDDAFGSVGATIAPDYQTTVSDADVVLKVRRPMTAAEGGLDELAALPKGAILAGILLPHKNLEDIKLYADAGITVFSMDIMPRITRAQSMDVLSSQSNLAGYKAVIDGAACYTGAFPMMMTAAGTVAPARVFVMGAGVAGLQAIATARRMGAIVSATDVRPVTREQVESLGATFVALPEFATEASETAGGYAREMGEDFQRRQAALVHETLKKQDIAICTALIPGRPAPTLITDEMVHDMKPGSVIVDMAVEAGGNCTLSKEGETVDVNGVKILGPINLSGRIAAATTPLYAKNLFNFLELLIDGEKGELDIDWEDEIVTETLITRDGAVVHPDFK